MKFLFAVIGVFILSAASAQQQACPVNSNFSLKDLTHWAAYTGIFTTQARTPIQTQPYDSTQSAPEGTVGTSTISEYQLPSVTGIRVITSPGIDQFGGFSTIPNVNGYQYTSAVLLGSTQISRGAAGGGTGGYIRGISYKITVPSSASTQPYTMTYAYAMVLENGQHNTSNQPWFTATLSTNDSIITCASPQYVLPTNNNAAGNGGGATLDTAAALASGFTLSRQTSPNPNPNGQNGGHLQDVWWKGWTEVTFDLSPYRGQQVVLTFEADNCVPGGHFAYAYIALRKTCAGLLISGDTVACTGGTLTYSIPALGGATYGWSVPGDWSVVSGADSNILKVIPGVQGGLVIAHELNSCANLQDELPVTTITPTIAGTLANDAEVCAENNSSIITLSGNRGSVLNWIASTDGGSNWSIVLDTTGQYVAQNLTKTTIYEALVQHGSSCAIDSSAAVKITVDPKSVGGILSPADQQVCTGQTKGAELTLNGNVGSILNWQTSFDGTNWNGFAPVYTDTTYNIVGLVATSDFRVLVKSGVCPVDSSSVAVAHLLPALFPAAATEPADTIICYGTPAKLNATISIGTNYTWSNAASLTNQGTGIISSTPFSIQATARPLKSTDYVLSILNAGCPNPLLDTFAVRVYPQVIVSAGNDTAIVINQPLQLQAIANDPADVFAWSPALGLSNTGIANPIALLDAETDSITYVVTATSPPGCTGTAAITVVVFKTQPDIFVPNAFTPGLATNNRFRPIAPGLASMQYFRVYNRYGQLVFSTSAVGQGWDGYLNGKLMPADSYVWMVKGITYKGKTIMKKGTMILIR